MLNQKEFEDLFVKILDTREELTKQEQIYINGGKHALDAFDQCRALSLLLTADGDTLIQSYQDALAQIETLKNIVNLMHAEDEA